MKQFILNLLSSKSEYSSKRFAALFVLFNVLAFAWLATTHSEDFTTPEFMFDSLLLFAGGGLGLTAIEKVFGSKKQNINALSTDGEVQ
jgi:hypothetical protein